MNNMDDKIDELVSRVIEALIKKPDYVETIKNLDDNSLIEILYFLLKEEKYEDMVIVRDEIIKRGININTESKFKQFEDIINKN